jgi:hypothetical protein
MSGFNPREFKSFSELPEEEKNNFQELEGGSFVRNTAEKNLELGHKLGSIENEVIDALKHDLELDDAIKEDALAKLKEADGKNDEDGFKKQAEELRRMADVEILSTGTDNTGIEQAIINYGNRAKYSEKTQQLVLEKVDIKDSELVDALLFDKRFTNKSDLIDLMDESSIQETYERVKSLNLDLARLLVNKSQDKDFKIKVFIEIPGLKRAVETSESWQDGLIKEDIKIGIAKQLIESGNNQELLDLCDQGLFNVDLLKPYGARICSNTILYQLAIRSAEPEQTFLPHISDPDTLNKIVETNASEFTRAESKSYVVENARIYREALVSEPEIFEVGKLEDQNKFLIFLQTFEISDGQPIRYYFTWGGLHTGGGAHKALLRGLTSEYRLGSVGIKNGGFIEISQQDDKTVVTFNKKSGDFGQYSVNILEKFRPQIEAALRRSLGKEVEVKMEVSS